MAKKKKAKTANSAQLAADSAPASAAENAAMPAPGSLLEHAWQAFSHGDMVTARKVCAEVTKGKATEKDQAFAAKLGPELFGRKDAPTEAAAVAAEIQKRTQPPGNTYWFGAVTAFVFAVLLLIARRG